MELCILCMPLFSTWENISADVRMRARYHFRPDSGGYAVPEVTLVAIDAETQRRLGQLNSTIWSGREPYFDLLAFLEEYFRPSVLAFDIVFEEMLGEGQERVSESGERVAAVMDDLARVAADTREAMGDKALYYARRLTAEQSSIYLAHRFASIMEREAFPVVLGYYFRGGFLEGGSEVVPRWSDRDVFGDSAEGDENWGARIPYLKDMAIPPANVHFPSEDAAQAYAYAPNAVLPNGALLDYSLLGCLDGPPDADGIVRRAPLVYGFEYRNSIRHSRTRVFVPSIALTACLLHLGLEFPLRAGDVEVFMGREVVIHSPERGDFHVPIDEKGVMYLNFSARLEDFSGVSFADLAPSRVTSTLEERRALAAEAKKKKSLVDREHATVDGCICIVATGAVGQDIGACPISSHTPLVLVHMTAIGNILERSFIAPLSVRGKACLLGALFLGFTGLCCMVRTSRLSLYALAAILVYLLVSYGGVHRSMVIIPVVPPVLYMVLCSFLVLTYRYFAEERAKQRIRGMFSTMVSDKVLHFLEENPDSFSLKGHDAEATVFFSDIADFTKISETLPPERLTAMLNEYLTPATDCIMARGGYVDKYVGDSIMAVWGAPYHSPDHAASACVAALEQQQIIRRLNRRMHEEYGVDLNVRMGINSGVVTAGTVGSQKKFQYTVLGDVVNTASRLEPTNRDFGTSIIIGSVTHRMAGERIVARPLGRIRVVGKEQAATIYELVGLQGRVPGGTIAVIATYEEALEHFFQRRWEECLAKTDEILAMQEDGPSMHLRRRALYYRANPPPEGWQGEYVREQKD